MFTIVYSYVRMCIETTIIIYSDGSYEAIQFFLSFLFFFSFSPVLSTNRYKVFTAVFVSTNKQVTSGVLVENSKEI